MKITLQGNEVNVKEDSFVILPHEWLWDDNLTIADTTRLARLYYRFDFFRNIAIERGISHPATNCMYLTQDAYAELLDLSRSKVSLFFKKLENLGYIARIKSGKTIQRDGVFETVPKDYLVVLNKASKHYENDLQDVKVALSQRLTALEEKNKHNQTTYKQMKKSYDLLFDKQERYVYTKSLDEFYKEVPLEDPPVYEEVPIDLLEEPFPIAYDNVTPMVSEPIPQYNPYEYSEFDELDEDMIPF